MSGPPGIGHPPPGQTNNNTQLIAIAAIGVFAVLCMGFGTSLVSALALSWLTSSPATSTNQGPDQVGKLVLTDPKDPVQLPPLPSNITSGPPLPESPIHPDQCDDLQHGGPLVGDEPCVTAEIHCDEMILGHTVGGVDEYDSEFYEKKFCWPKLLDHDGGDERIYKLVMPPGEWRAWATLHTPCTDLDLMAIRYDRDACPDWDSQINQCEMKPQSSTRPERIELVSQTKPDRNATWYIVVEGKLDYEGPFSLHVQCAPGLSGGY